MTLPYHTGFMYAAAESASKDLTVTVCKSPPDLAKEFIFHMDGFQGKVVILDLFISLIYSSILLQEKKSENEKISTKMETNEREISSQDQNRENSCPPEKDNNILVVNAYQYN